MRTSYGIVPRSKYCIINVCVVNVYKNVKWITKVIGNTWNL